MDVKKIGFALVLLGIGLIVFGSLQHTAAPAKPAEIVHVLTGTTTPAGNYAYAEVAPYYTIEATYPATTTLEGSADGAARLAIETALAGRIAEFKKNGNLDALTPEDIKIQGLGPDRKYALDMSYKIYTAPQYVSVVYTIYEDTLGAHPNAYYLTFLFDKAGQKVGIESLLSGNRNGLALLAQRAAVQVGAELKKRMGAEDTTGLLFAEGFAPTADNYSNFYVDGGDLVVLFPPYQVAPYAAGAFEARVPLRELK